MNWRMFWIGGANSTVAVVFALAADIVVYKAILLSLAVVVVNDILEAVSQPGRIK